MRALWRGAIAFGLVHIPIKVYAATEDRDISFRQLHTVCHTPIRYQKWCPTCEKVLEADEIVRGYEHARGQYVIVDDEALESLAEGVEKTVDVLHFVDLHEIDPVFFDRSYYVEPDAGGGRAYKLLQETLRQRERVAVSRVVLRSRPRLAAIRVGPEGILTMQTLHYPDEIRSPGELLASWVDKAVDEAELDLAMQLVDQRSVPFEPGNYEDKYREAVLAHVEERLAAAPARPAPAAPAARVVDLIEALKASLQQGNGDGRTVGNGAGQLAGAGQRADAGTDHTGADGATDGSKKTTTRARTKTRTRTKAEAKAEAGAKSETNGEAKAKGDAKTKARSETNGEARAKAKTKAKAPSGAVPG